MTSKPPCRYGSSCFRKNPQHLADFSHPTATTAAAPAPVTTAAPSSKPALDKPTPLTPHTAAVAAQDALDQPMPSAAAASSTSAANAGKKRTRAVAEEPAAAAAPAKLAAAPAAAAAKPAAGKAAASGKPAAAAGAAAASSSSSSSSSGAAQQALPDSAQDKVFELTDEELEPATVTLWQRFHAGCWATSCPVHSLPSAPAAFFAQGAALLKALYGGLEFPADLMHLLQFAVKAHHAAAEKECCKVEFQPDAKVDNDATATDATAAATSGDGAAAAAAAPSVSEAVSGSSSCSWHACCAAIRSVFVSTAGVELAGSLRVLLGEFRHQSPQSVHPFLLDRGFYDSAEVWTFLAVVSGEGASNFRHYAYYRDDPRPAYPAAFVGVLNASEPTVTPVGPNALAALLHAVDTAQQEAGGGAATTTAKRQKVASGAAAAALATSTGPWTLDQLRSELESYGKTHGLLKGGGSGKKAAPAPKRDPAWLKRDKKVVCDLDNGVGLVVPYVDDIGWRPVNCENEQLTKIVKDIEAAKYSGKTVNFDALDHLVTLTQYANDERDAGMGIELALQLFAKSSTNAVNSDVVRLLSMGYSLVDRELYGKVVDQHLRHRGKRGVRPQHAWIKHDSINGSSSS